MYEETILLSFDDLMVCGQPAKAGSASYTKVIK